MLEPLAVQEENAISGHVVFGRLLLVEQCKKLIRVPRQAAAPRPPAYGVVLPFYRAAVFSSSVQIVLAYRLRYCISFG